MDVKLDDKIVTIVRIVGARKANVGIAGATPPAHTSAKYAVLHAPAALTQVEIVGIGFGCDDTTCNPY